MKNPFKKIKFTDDELKFIKGRIEIELQWGPSVYDEEQIKLMQSINNKLIKILLYTK